MFLARNVLFLFFIVLGVAQPASSVPAQPFSLCHDPSWLQIRYEDGSAIDFFVEVARTPDERAVGLMDRLNLEQDHGMLFVYPAESSISFWMKNTLIPLDMLFADSNGIIHKVHKNAIPMDETTIFGGTNVQYVLEINGGMADELNITPGMSLIHSAIPASLKEWNCE